MAYTTIDNPSEFFQTVLYTGDGSADNDITGVGFAPDWVWAKNRGAADAHWVLDSTRGATKGLYTNGNAAENTQNHLISFDSDGFSVGNQANGLNTSSNNYVSWNWKCNGGTTTSQTGSDINSVTQVNTDAKFSIVTYNGASGSDSADNGGAYWRVKHGLGSVPKFAIFKSTTHVHGWYVWHHGFSGASKSDGDHIVLNTVAAMASEGSQILWGNTEWSTTEFEIGGWDVVNRSGKSYIAYMFDEVKGYSKFGSYTGNGNADGPFVYTGFKPAWLMIKRSDADGENWQMFDNKRDGFNNGSSSNKMLKANVSETEDTNSTGFLDLLSNGFKIRESAARHNASGGYYIYMAFAEHPFVSSEGVPTTAR